MELRLARLGLFQRVQNNSYRCEAFIVAVLGRFPFDAHDTVLDGKLCERANPWAQQFWQHIQGLNEVDQGECLLFFVGGPHYGHVWTHGVFFASVTAQSFGIFS